MLLTQVKCADVPTLASCTSTSWWQCWQLPFLASSTNIASVMMYRFCLGSILGRLGLVMETSHSPLTVLVLCVPRLFAAKNDLHVVCHLQSLQQVSAEGRTKKLLYWETNIWISMNLFLNRIQENTKGISTVHLPHLRTSTHTHIQIWPNQFKAWSWIVQDWDSGILHLGFSWDFTRKLTTSVERLYPKSAVLRTDDVIGYRNITT